MSNLCTEIFQLQTPTLVGDAGEVVEAGFDISCNLGSLNIVNVMEQKKLAESVHTAMDALTAVSDASAVRQVPGVLRANQAFHSVGLGVMNLHGFLAKNQIPYESEEARDFVRSFFAAMNYHSLERSMEIARERGQTFFGFEKSEYANGHYFERYLHEDFRPRTETVKKLFEGVPLPSPADWARLKEAVQQHGLYHAYRLAVAPTASISYIQNATPSIQPIVEYVETRTYGNATTYYPMPFLSEETYWFYKSAYHMNMYRVIDLVAEAQPHVDQGISTVLFVTSETSTRELARLYVYAAKKGLKSLYYTRTKNLSVEECLTCSV
jgi:ribonucleoside-diphosphate reductase alpha chain